MPTTGAYEFQLAPAAGAGGVIAEEDLIARGTWAWIDRGPYPWLAICVRCPDCGMLGTLWRRHGANDQHGHQIDAQGNIAPSVGCPNPQPCGFHTQPTKLANFSDRR